MYAGSRKQGDFFKVMSVMAIGDETLYDGWTGEHVDGLDGWPKCVCVGCSFLGHFDSSFPVFSVRSLD